jgi:hypothetical protein
MTPPVEGRGGAPGGGAANDNVPNAVRLQRYGLAWLPVLRLATRPAPPEAGR